MFISSVVPLLHNEYKRLIFNLLFSMPIIKRVLASCVNILSRLQSFHYPAFSNPLTTGSFCSLKYSYISNSHFACSDFRSVNFRETFTSSGDFPLNWSETNLFAFWLIVKSSDWNLYVKLWGTMIDSRLFSKHKDLISLFCWPLKVSTMISEPYSCGYPSSIFFARRYGDIIFSNKSTHFLRFDQWFFEYATLNSFVNLYLGKHLSVAPW